MLIFMSVTSDLLAIAEYIVSIIAVAICIFTYESVHTTFDQHADELSITRTRIFGKHTTVIQKGNIVSIDRLQKGKKKKAFATTVVTYRDNNEQLRRTCDLIIMDFMFSDENDDELYKALIDWRVREKENIKKGA